MRAMHSYKTGFMLSVSLMLSLVGYEIVSVPENFPSYFCKNLYVHMHV